MRTKLATILLVVAMAIPAMGELKKTVESLNDAIKETSLKTVIPELAKLMDVESTVMEKAMLEGKLKLSDVAFAKLVSEKTKQPITDWLTVGNASDWPGILQRNNLREREVEEYLDGLQSEVAFLMLDFRDKRKR